MSCRYERALSDNELDQSIRIGTSQRGRPVKPGQVVDNAHPQRTAYGKEIIDCHVSWTGSGACKCLVSVRGST